MTFESHNVGEVAVCHICGSLVADGWQPEHTAFHAALAALAEQETP